MLIRSADIYKKKLLAFRDKLEEIRKEVSTLPDNAPRDRYVYDIINILVEQSRKNPAYVFYVSGGEYRTFMVSSEHKYELSLFSNDSRLGTLAKIVANSRSPEMMLSTKLYMEVLTALKNIVGSALNNLRINTIDDLIRKIYENIFDDLTFFLESEPAKMTSDPKQYTFKFIDSTKIVDGPHPAWDEFTSRLDYPKYFMSWVGALFDPENTSRRILFLYGNGNDGKSVIIGAISELYGRHGIGSISNSILSESRFALGSLYDKSFVVYPDCKNPQVIRHEIIQQLTGNDHVANIERKNENMFTAPVYAKLVVNTNHYPKISSYNRNELSRFLLVKVGTSPKKHGDKTWKSRLLAEGYHFIYDCIKTYKEMKIEESEEVSITDDYYKSILPYVTDREEELVKTALDKLFAFKKIKPDYSEETKTEYTTRCEQVIYLVSKYIPMNIPRLDDHIFNILTKTYECEIYQPAHIRYYIGMKLNDYGDNFAAKYTNIVEDVKP